MKQMGWLLLALAAVMVVTMLGMVATSAPAAEYPNVAQLQPFSAESNYMSLPGYLRWMVFQQEGVWLSVAEAKQIVAEQKGG